MWLTLADIGEHIARARKQHKLRQAEVAVKAGVSRSTIDALENGRASEIGYSKLIRILAVLGLELELGPMNAKRPTIEDLLKEQEND
jgi:transcriptional regulator with XRE-family HTH domain